MKKQTHTWTNYIPLLIAVVTVMGTIIGGVLTLVSNNKAMERDIAWLKENSKETKAEIVNLKHSINISDESMSDIFKEILDRLEADKVKKKGKDK